MVSRKNRQRNPLNRNGATLGLAVALTIVLVIIGAALFTIASTIFGAKELANATDSGLLNAANAIEAVSIPLSSSSGTPASGPGSITATSLPVLFRALAVLPNGTPATLTTDSNGNAVPPAGSLINILSYNRAAIATLQMAENAAEENTTASIANANALIAALTTEGEALNYAISQANLSGDINSAAGNNSLSFLNVLGTTSAITAVPGTLSLAQVTPEGTTGADVYFSSNVANDPTQKEWNQSVIAAGTQSQANESFESSSQGYQSGQPLLAGYTPINIGTLTGVSHITGSIYLVPNASNVHLISSQRFNAALSSASASDYAPVNAIQSQTSTSVTGSGSSPNSGNGNNNNRANSSGSGPSRNMALSALAAAISGNLGAQYVCSIPTGYIRIHNNGDAIAVDSSLPSTIYKFSSFPSIFNTEYWTGTGGLGGVNVTTCHSANVYSPTGALLATQGQVFLTAAGDPYNGIYATEDWESVDGTDAPSGYTTSTAEIQAWINYCNSTGNDSNGHNPSLLPSTVLGYPSPSANLRAGDGQNLKPTAGDLLHLGGATITNCNSFSPGMGTTSASNSPYTPAYINLGIFNISYYGNWDCTSVNAAQVMDTGMLSGGLTNLEYVKSEVMQAWINAYSTLTTGSTALNAVTTTAGIATFGATTFPVGPTTPTKTMPTAPTGVRIYDRTGETGFASPSNTNGLCSFSSVDTPYNLINNQIYGSDTTNYGQSACANISDTTSSASPWNDVSTPLGALLYRCQQICPSATAAQVSALLNTTPIDLNGFQFIYLPAGGTQLIISTSAPSWVGTTQSMPDGNPTASCSNLRWSDTIDNAIDAFIHVGEYSTGSGTSATENITGANRAGDCDLHDAPWEIYSGSISTQDSFYFVPSSGYDATVKDNLLGVLRFDNTVSGSAQFSNPN